MEIRPCAWEALKPSEIRPRGWLKRQLEIQAAGLSGHLDKIWPDIRDSRWIGGDREGWERVPYWLDGFIPLAYLLDDADMKARAARYINGILERQQEDGWICPCAPEERSRYDMWALILIAKVLVLYAEHTGDVRIQPALAAALRNFNDHIDRDAHTLSDWAAARWLECLIPILWLYERTGEGWLLDLAGKLEAEGFHYEKLFAHYRDQEPQRRWTQLTHVVNLAMSLKMGALTSRLYGNDPNRYAQEALEILERYHGTAYGHFTGDECTSGDSPIQGTELCGVVEAMYSYEILLAVSGDAAWGDRLERLAFNALPATMSEDMWTHQYVQMVNQVECSRLPEDHVVFRTNNREAHLFGLEPNFGCCTANFSQGWPKLAEAAFGRSGNGLVSALLLPSEADVEIGGSRVRCTLDTDYPFKGRLLYTVTADKPVEFALSIRIPSFAAGAAVDGEPVASGGFHTMRRRWEGVTQVEVQLDFACRLVPRPREMACLWRGPLLYALRLDERWERWEYERDGVERRFPYCDYQVYAESPWNYGYASESFVVRERDISETPFSHDKPPVEIEAELAPLDWPFVHGVCALMPTSRKPIGPVEKKIFIPYGCTYLRMTEMPVL